MITKHNFYALRRLIRQMKKTNVEADNLLSVMAHARASTRGSISTPLDARLSLYKAQWNGRISPFPVSTSAYDPSDSAYFSTARTALLFDVQPRDVRELFYTLRRSCRAIGAWETDELFYRAWRSCCAPYGVHLPHRLSHFKAYGKIVPQWYRIPVDERFW